MPADTFICGTCQTSFSEIEQFVEHKKIKCEPQPAAPGPSDETRSDVTNQGTEAAVKLTQGDPSSSTTTLELIQIPMLEGGTLSSEQAEAIVNAANVSSLFESESTILPVKASVVMESPTVPVSLEILKTPQTGRKRGRPRKGEERPKKKPTPKVDWRAKEDELANPSVGVGKDGKFFCPKCKRVFSRMRHFTSHRCLANSDYVDISRRDSLPDFDNAEESEQENILDIDVNEASMIRTPKRRRTEKKINLTKAESTQILDGGEQVEPNITVENAVDEKGDELVLYPYTTTSPTPIKEKPMFANEEEKKQFEENLNIDLSQIDHMFKMHIIEQDVNENAPPTGNRATPELTIFSCNTCDKVFKTISHMRHHCLIHTNLKPFKCPRCSYGSNSKGNLYTHMRKHTGQYFHCKDCPFKTVSRSHLAEHVLIHDAGSYKCRLCKKDYNTHKSLVNHVRKYHQDTQEGVDYYKEFTPRVNKGQAVLHQCHICNRKFKKRIDRDRHLFIHNIRSNPNIHTCELCTYTASRQVYLENHIRKHRVIYQCATCDEKFLSTIRLNDHLSERHLSSVDPENTDKTWGELFEASINCSMYLPEPDGTIDHLGQGYLTVTLQPENLIVDDAEPNASSETDQATMDLKKVEIVMEEPRVDPTAAAGAEGQLLISQNITAETAQPSHIPSEAEGESDVPEVQTACSSNVREVVDSQSTSDGLNRKEVCGGQDPTQDLDQVRKAEPDASGAPTVAADATEATAMDAQEKSGDTLEKADDKSAVRDSGDNAEETTEGQGNMDDHQDRGENAGVDAEGGKGGQEKDQGTPGDEAESNAITPKAEFVFQPLEEQMDQDTALRPENLEGVKTTEEVKQNEVRNSMYLKLDYKPMNMNVLTKLRDTFGNQECEFCGRLFYSQLDYDPHIKTHTGEKPFACDQCEYRSITRENLKRHQEKNHQHIYLKCDKCDYVAKSRTQLWTHKHKHMEAELPSNMCPVCQLMFPSKKKLGEHILTSHPEMSREEAKKVTGYNHRIQGKIGRRSYKCPYCDKVFARANSDLRKHVWIHEGIKPFKCSLCPHACRSLNNLKSHMLRHSQNKPFMCGDCGKLYKSRTALRWHMRSHKEGKPFKCDKCPYSAIQKSHLKRHMETHEVVKKFVCELCDYSANTLGYLKIHYTKFHPDVRPPRKGQGEDISVQEQSYTVKTISPNTKAFKCLSCDYIFGNIWDIKKHLKVRHHLHVEDIRALECTEVSQIVPADLVGAEGMPEVEIQVTDEPVGEVQRQTDENDAREALETLQYAGPSSGEIDEKTASAVNILQQIIDMSQQGTFQGQPQQITVQGQDGQMVTVNPETIIVQQDGEVVVSSDAQLESGEFVIHYLNQETGGVSTTETVVTSAQAVESIISLPVSEDATQVLPVSSATEFLLEGANVATSSTVGTETVIVTSHE